MSHETLFRHDNDLNGNADDLDCPPPVTRSSKGNIEEALGKLQDLSLFISFGDEIRSLSRLTDFFQVVN